MAPDRLRADERGQMMLLTAIILLLGFIALAGMVSRVSLLAGQAGREQDRPLLREIEPLQQGVNGALANLQNFTAATPPIPYPPSATNYSYEAAARGMLQHLRQSEAARGFLMEWRIYCATGSDRTTAVAQVSLSDGELTVKLTSNLKAYTSPPKQYFTISACPTLTAGVVPAPWSSGFPL